MQGIGRDACLSVPEAPPLFRASRSMEVRVEVVLLTELVGERNAGEQLAPLALDGIDVEEHHESGEQAQEHHQEHDDLAAFAVHVHAAEADVGQEGE